MSLFGGLDLGGLQRVLFPVIEALGGPDIQGEISEKAVAFDEAADVLDEAAALLRLAGAASSDGILTNEEIESIIAAAPTVKSAVDELLESLGIGGDEAE